MHPELRDATICTGGGVLGRGHTICEMGLNCVNSGEMPPVDGNRDSPLYRIIVQGESQEIMLTR